MSLTVSPAIGHHIPSRTQSHQHSIAQSGQDASSKYTTEFTQLPSYVQESTPSHGSHSQESTPLIHRRAHPSSHSQESTPELYSSCNSGISDCTCSYSYGSPGHLEPPETLPLSRYGYPDADNYPHHHHRQYSEEQW